MTNTCVICGETDIDGSTNNIGFHYGNISCVACKKFFIRSETNQQYLEYKCNNNKVNSNCSITIQSRTTCQFCRYNKCKQFNMNLKSRLNKQPNNNKLEMCAICNCESSGIHFGILSCEGCKVDIFI